MAVRRLVYNEKGRYRAALAFTNDGGGSSRSDGHGLFPTRNDGHGRRGAPTRGRHHDRVHP
ncbi:hypothetical protein AB7M16_003304 [Bradyrhizobium sp. USDA 372]